MPRNRLYLSDAERQQAYRDRRAGISGNDIVSIPVARRRQPSRPSRLAALCNGATQLQGEYQAWLESLPEALQDGDQATRLTEAIEALEAVVDLLSQIEPPRGFGRD